MDHLHLLTRAFRQHAPTWHGQLTGLAMIITPALTHPLPFGGALHATVQFLAVIIGSAGALVVFGGLFQRVWLLDDGTRHAATAAPAAPATANATDGEGENTATVTAGDSAAPAANEATAPAGPPVPLDDVLVALPHARTVWAGLVLLSAALAAGALWCLVLAFTGDWDERLTDVLMLGLPAAALGWAAWRGRVMWAPAADRAPSPVAPSEQT